MNEMDHILADQLVSARRRLKVINKLLKLMPDDSNLYYVKDQIEKNIAWYESMIQCNKLRKKRGTINIRRTFVKIVYMVRFFYFYKTLLRKNKKGKN